MGRLTQALAYINSSTEDWQGGGMTSDFFTHFSITDEARVHRKWYRKGTEETFEEYKENLKKRKYKLLTKK